MICYDCLILNWHDLTCSNVILYSHQTCFGTAHYIAKDIFHTKVEGLTARACPYFFFENLFIEIWADAWLDLTNTHLPSSVYL